MNRPPFPRQVHYGDDGTDIDGHKRAMHRFLQDGLLDDHEAKPKAVQRHAGAPPSGWSNLLKKSLRKAQQPAGDVFTERLYKALWAQDAYDLNAANEIIRYNLTHPGLALVHPIPSNIVIQNRPALHETGGLPGNWALDWIVDAGSPVVAVEKATISRLSGSDPASDVNDPFGIYGWSIQYVTPKGIQWFWTHFGRRIDGLHVGQVVDPGEPIGFVGNQQFRADHSHGGASHPLGEAAARKHVLAVNNAPRVTL
jgi:hypothetical protein